MPLTRQLLQTAMNRLLSKLNILTQPRVVIEGFCLGPLPAEIRASAELMTWFAGELPATREEFQTELVAQHRNWPNVHDWRNFVKAIEALSVETDGITSAKVANTSRTEPKPTSAEAQAIDAFAQARTELLEQCRLMLELAPGAAAPTKACNSPFLPNDSQRRVYREYVQTYYRENIVGKNLKHKDQMIHWAAVYQAIADRTGLCNVPFCGPAFDAFVFDYCGIPYNASATPRGRYRSIQDLNARCMDRSTDCPQRADFDLYRRAMNEIIGRQQRVVPRRGSDVPRKLI